MASLCGDEASARERGDAEGVRRAQDLQRRLLEEHLLDWVPALCARIRENARGPFYRGVAALTGAVLRHERDEMGGPAPPP